MSPNLKIVIRLSSSKVYKITEIHMKKLHLLLATVILLSQTIPAVVLAADEPVQTYFYVSGYYSPQEGQSFYLRGNLESEKKLNGAGIRGASGIAVHEGMLAAPKGYSFGTKIKLEGLGIGTVEDRGGAIVPAGQRGYSHDRIDVWMGYGEEGLKRALSWGIRKVAGTVYPSGSTVADTINVENVQIANINWAARGSNSGGSSLIKRNLGKWDTGEDVQKLQEILVELHYLGQDPGSSFDATTVDAVFRFQVDQGIVKKDTDKGAGYCGEKTRKALEKKWYELKEQERKEIAAVQTEKQKFVNSFPVQLGKNKGSAEAIKTLQNALLDIGYSVDVNGKYDKKTIAAVTKFQTDQGIISKDTDYGAGFFGNQTRLFLVEKVWTKRQAGKQEQTSPVKAEASVEKKSTVKPVAQRQLFGEDLHSKSKGENVRELQSALKELGLLNAEPTGNYGPKTKEAVAAFQVRFKLLGSTADKNAGTFGPVTRAKFQDVWSKYQERKIVTELDGGQKGIEVAKLQNLLKNAGYFDQEITGLFGAKTREALIAFQLEKQVIADEKALGAGRVGRATLSKLNEVLAGFLEV